ncbi:OLC1v1018650C1 [Oldenlandia corymbosa var. corymbosa]|uniref:OLC1v1018650C1 n=1 Tax=Oldenlandia corymbosa var. corymbosa TaxID=529605 RepID=A0AAV1EC66_OLDCO|nr:OLC1v1018650C1 [Oldenlandia corymbosa var. corymbosa]
MSDVPDSSLLLESGTRDMYGQVISTSYRRGSLIEDKSKGESQMGQAGKSMGLDDVFDHASLDLQNVSDNDDVPTEDIDSEGFNNFIGDSPPHSPPARRSNIIRLRVRGLGAASASASASASSSAFKKVVLLGHVAHRLTDKLYKPSLEMDTRVTYFKLLKEWKGSMLTEAQILLAGRLITAQPGTVDCKTLIMRALRITSQTLQTSKVIHGGGVQSGLVPKTGRAATLALDQVTAWLWVMLGNMLFTDRSGTRIRVAILSEFIDGLVTCGNISWGSVTLAYLYHQVEWLPFCPDPVFDDLRTIYSGWIQYQDIIEPYLPSRVLRQIGYIQVIPPPIPHPLGANRSGNHHAYKVS